MNQVYDLPTDFVVAAVVCEVTYNTGNDWMWCDEGHLFDARTRGRNQGSIERINDISKRDVVMCQWCKQSTESD